jgi:hypothetical protein
VGRPEYYGNPAGLTADIDVVRAIYAAFAVRDLEGALDFVDPKCEIYVETTAREGGRKGTAVVVMGHVEGQGEQGAFRRAAIWTWRLSGGRAVQLRVADMGEVRG